MPSYKGKEVEKPGLFQFILIILNLCIFIVGVCIFIAGVAMKSPAMFERVMAKVKEEGKVPGPILNIVKTTIQEASFVGTAALLVGFIILAVAFMGCCGAMCSPTLLKYYQMAIVIMMLLVGILGYTAFQMSGAVPLMIAKGLSKVFPHYSNPIAQKVIHVIQINGQCCGSKSPGDWKTMTKWNQYHNLPAFQNVTKGATPVPYSCCFYPASKPGGTCGMPNNYTFDVYYDQAAPQMFNPAQQADFELKHGQLFALGNSQDFDATNSAQFGSMDGFTAGGGVKPTQSAERSYVEDDDEEEYRLQARAPTLAPGQVIWPQGCAIKYGIIFLKQKKNILVYTIVFMIPELICLVMAWKVSQYLVAKKESEA